MKVYLSGPISGLPFDVVHRRFLAASDYLTSGSRRGLGLVPVSPLSIPACNECTFGVDRPDHNHTWAEWMREDIKEMLKCDGIYMLKDWEQSPGARLEHYIAISCGLQVVGDIRTGIVE